MCGTGSVEQTEVEIRFGDVERIVKNAQELESSLRMSIQELMKEKKDVHDQAVGTVQL
jgi:hypothetical protein